jgi:hypothetical protein
MRPLAAREAGISARWVALSCRFRSGFGSSSVTRMTAVPSGGECRAGSPRHGRGGQAQGGDAGTAAVDVEVGLDGGRDKGVVAAGVAANDLGRMTVVSNTTLLRPQPGNLIIRRGEPNLDDNGPRHRRGRLGRRAAAPGRHLIRPRATCPGGRSAGSRRRPEANSPSVTCDGCEIRFRGRRGIWPRHH